MDNDFWDRFLTNIWNDLPGFLLILGVILWLFLPFAIYGIKEKLNKIIENQEMILGQLKYMNMSEAEKKKLKEKPKE